MTSIDASPGRADAHVPLTAALAALLALSLFMAVASLAGTVPSPPHDKLPFVAGNIALVVAALVVACGRHRAAPWVAAFAALSYLPSVGPHKILTEVHAAALTPVMGSAPCRSRWSGCVRWRCGGVGGEGDQPPDRAICPADGRNARLRWVGEYSSPWKLINGHAIDQIKALWLNI